MRRDPTVFLLGEDVAEAGTPFKILSGLVEEFGTDRIIDTPISEPGFTGIAVCLIGRNHPFGIILASILFGILYQGGAELSFDFPDIDREMIQVVQALVVLFSGALSLMLVKPTEKLFVYLDAKKKAKNTLVAEA